MKPRGDETVLKLLHTADWRLGRRFRAFDDAAAEKLSRARFEAVDRAFHEAERHQVDAILCAGDLFDEPQPASEAVEGLLSILRNRPGQARPVFLLPGNRDPVMADSIWLERRFRDALPPHVTVVERASEHALPNGATLLAIPCEARANPSSPAERIPLRSTSDDRIRIGLIHGTPFDEPGAALNFPISGQAAVERGLDYLGAGGTASFRELREPDRAPTVFPGSPERNDFSARGIGEVSLVFISRLREAVVQRRQVGVWAWEELEIRSMKELRALASRVDLKDKVVRVVVDLVVSARELSEAEHLLETLLGNETRLGLAGVFDLQRTRLELDVESVETWVAQLPPVLRATAVKLTVAAKEKEHHAAASRALFHLYRVTRGAS